jgi:hypothetical protein
VLNYVDVEKLIAGPPGDYNDSGTVDAADYVVWRKVNGASETLPNDNGLGAPIDTAHFNLWKTNFGRTLAVSGNSAVPEPSASAALLLVMPWAGARSRSRANSKFSFDALRKTLSQLWNAGR